MFVVLLLVYIHPEQAEKYGRALGSHSKDRRLHSRRGQAFFSARPLWIQGNNTTNMISDYRASTDMHQCLNVELYLSISSF